MEAGNYDPGRGFPRVVPELACADVAATAEWLVRVLGFTELLRFTGVDGVLRHVDLELESGVVMLTPGRPGPDDGLTMVLVDDVDAHRARAMSAGGRAGTLQDRPWGLRRYRVRDPDGRLWELGQFVRAVAPAAWGAVPAAGSAPALKEEDPRDVAVEHVERDDGEG